MQPRTVLCIDDDRDLLAMSKTYLETAGYRVLTALSGPEGLGILVANSVDAVVVDYQMPAMTGEEVARQVREAHPDIPIILFTGDVENIPRSVLEIVDICIAKGAPTKNLVIALAQLMRGQEAGWPKPRSLRRFRVEVPVMLKIDRAGTSNRMIAQRQP